MLARLRYDFEYLIYLLRYAWWFLRFRVLPRPPHHPKSKSSRQTPASRARQLLFITALFFLPTLLALVAVKIRTPKEAQASWFDPSWGYRKKIPITNTSSAQTDYQVMVTEDTATLVAAGKLQSDCDDLRFTNQGGNLLSFWVEPTTCNTSSTKVWVKVPSIHAASSGTTTDIYLYYGNPSSGPGATSTSDVFIRDMSSASAAWPLTETSGSLSSPTHPAVTTGRDIVIDGGFDDTSKWTKDAGWTVSGGVGVATSAAGAIAQSIPIVAGKSYTITFTVSGYSSGGVYIKLGNNGTYGTARTANGTYTETLVAVGNTTMNISAVGTSTLNIDSLSVKQLNIPDSSTFTGTEKLTDGNMETSGTAAWSSVRGAALTKQTTSPHGGSQLIRIARSGLDSFGILNNPNQLVAGKSYRVTGYTRSDGNLAPIVQVSGIASYFTGTTSTSWQSFDVVVPGGQLTFGSNTAASDGQYVEYDDLSVTEVSPMTGVISGATLNSASGDTRFGPSYSFDGSNDYVNIYSSDLNSAFNPSEGTLVTWAKVASSGVWTDGTQRFILLLQATNSQNQIVIAKSATNNRFDIGYDAGGTNYNTTKTSYSPTNWIQVALTWSKSSDQVKAYINGIQEGSTLTGINTWVGNFTSTTSVIGAANSSGSNSWSGLIGDTRLYTRALSAAEISDLYGTSSSGRRVYYTGNLPGHDLIRKYDTGVTLGSAATEELAPGPIAYWKFDEGTGTTAQDSTSNNKDGSISGATWTTEDQCVGGKCLYFDGSNDVVTVSGTVVGVQTVSFWAKLPSTTTTEQLLDLNGTDYLTSVSGTITAAAFGTETIYIDGLVGTTITANVWHHIAVTTTSGLTASAIKIGQISTNYGQAFIDEVKLYPYARSAAEIKSDYVRGQAPHGASAVLGATVTNPLTDGLVGYWKMNETSGTTVADASGNSNTGTLTNAQESGTSDTSGNSTTTLVDTDGSLSTTDDAYNGMILNFTATCGSITSGTQRLISDYTGSSKTFTVTTALAAAPNSCAYSILHQVGGKFGSGVQFTSDDNASIRDYINIPHSTSVSTNYTNGTISVWVYRKGSPTSSAEGILGRGECFGIGGYASGSDTFRIYDGSAYHTTTSFQLATNNNQWQHLVATWGEQGMKLYINGVLASTDPYTGTAGGANCNSLTVYGWNVGFRYQQYERFKGVIDDFRLYSRALSAAEVSALYSWAPGPIAHYKLDEATGTTANDSSGNGNTAYLYGDGWTTGKIGGALNSINADNNYVLASSTQINTLKSTTWSAWVKLRSKDGTSRHVLEKYYTSGDENILYINANNNLFAFQVLVDGTEYTASTTAVTINANQWYYLTGTYDGDTVNLYVDGILRNNNTSPTGPGNFTGSGCFSIGARNQGDANCSSSTGTVDSVPFDGSLDDVRIYNYARTPNQILQDMNADASTVLGTTSGGQPEPLVYWKLDEQTGNTINNSGTGSTTYNGTNSGAAWLTRASCKNNGCLNFDTTTDYVSVGDVAFVDGLTGFSTSFWLNPQSLATQRIIISKAGAAQRVFQVRTSDSSSSEINIYIAASVSDTSNYCHTTNLGLTTSSWQHISIVYDGTQSTGNNNRLKVYKNGTLLSCTVYGTIPTSLLSGTTSNLKIGSDDYASSSLATYMDDLKIYNSALTADQIKMDYNAGSAITMGGVLGVTEASTLSDGAGNPPVAQWNFDEKSGTVANDTSGNGNTGTITGATWTTGKIGPGLSFNGSDSRVSFPSSLSSNLTAAGSYTITAWFYPKSSSGLNTIINLYNSSDTSRHGILLSGSTLYAGYYKGSYAGSAISNITPNTWHHITLVNNSGTVSTYLDGGLDTDGPIAGLGTDNYIGYSSPNGNYFNGLIDHVTIYNYARTPAQVAYDYNRGASVAWYKMDECQGTTLNNSSPLSSTLNGTLSLGSSGVTSPGTCNTSSTAWGNGSSGKYSASMSFDGTDDYIDAGDPSSGALDMGTSDFTLSAWIKTSEPTKAMRIINKRDASNIGYEMYLGTGSNNLCFAIGDSGGMAYNCKGSTNLLRNGSWHHVLMVADRDGYAQYYVDGKRDDSNEMSISGRTGSVDNSTNLTIGKYRTSTDYFSGSIDDVRIYNYALSATQVKKLYNENSSIRFGP